MIQLNFREIGIDKNPVEGSNIIFFDGVGAILIEKDDFQMSKVFYNTGDENLSVDESIANGMEFCYDSNLNAFVDDDYNQIKITIETIDGHQLTKGIKWIYDHEFHAEMNPTFFPFQDQRSFAIAENNGWIKTLSSNLVSYADKDFSIEETVKIKDFSKKNEIAYLNRVEKEQSVLFNGIVFKLVWYSVLGREFIFNYYELED